jgi:hypothetical protein
MWAVSVVFVDGGFEEGAAVSEGIIGGFGVEFFFKDAISALDTPVILGFFGGQDEQSDAEGMAVFFELGHEFGPAVDLDGHDGKREFLFDFTQKFFCGSAGGVAIHLGEDGFGDVVVHLEVFDCYDIFSDSHMVDLDQVAWGGGFHAVQPGSCVFFKDAFAFGAQGREVFVNFFYAQINGDDTIFQFHRGLLRQSFKPLWNHVSNLYGITSKRVEN